MNGIGGLKPLEAGRSIAKAVTDTTKQQATQWGKAAISQVIGKPVGQTAGNQAPSQKAPDAMGDFGKLFEQNQSQQTPTSNPSQQAPRPDHTAEFKQQNDKDQVTLAAARNELQKLEQDMAKIKQEREQHWAEQNKEEEEEKKMEDIQEQQQNQQPVRAGSPSPEGGKKKG